MSLIDLSVRDDASETQQPALVLLSIPPPLLHAWTIVF